MYVHTVKKVDFIFIFNIAQKKMYKNTIGTKNFCFQNEDSQNLLHK